MKILLLSKGYVDAGGEFHNEEEIYRNSNALKAERYIVSKQNAHGRAGDAFGPAGDTGGAFGGTGNTGVSKSGVFGGVGTGMGGAFGGAGSAGVSKGGAFGGAFGGSGAASGASGGAFGSMSAHKPSEPPTEPAAVPGGFAKKAGPAENPEDAEELRRSKLFNSPVSLPGRHKKKTLYAVLEEFLSLYKRAVYEDGKRNALYQKVDSFICSSLQAAMKQIMIYGTAPFGQRGLILKKPKINQKSLIFHEPKFKKKATLNPQRRHYEIAISSVCGDKDVDGNTPVNHILIEYYK